MFISCCVYSVYTYINTLMFGVKTKLTKCKADMQCDIFCVNTRRNTKYKIFQIQENIFSSHWIITLQFSHAHAP